MQQQRLRNKAIQHQVRRLRARQGVLPIGVPGPEVKGVTAKEWADANRAVDIAEAERAVKKESEVGDAGDS